MAWAGARRPCSPLGNARQSDRRKKGPRRAVQRTVTPMQYSAASARSAIGGTVMHATRPRAPKPTQAGRSRHEELSIWGTRLVDVEMGRDAWGSEGIYIDERASSGRPADRASQSHSLTGRKHRRGPFVYTIEICGPPFPSRAASRGAPCSVYGVGGGGARADSVCAVLMTMSALVLVRARHDPGSGLRPRESRVRVASESDAAP